MKSSSYIGRCPARDCRHAKHIDRPANAEAWWHPMSLHLKCPTHGKLLNWQAIEGKYSAAHVCDIRCMTATGPDCECSCGGLNHGRGFHVEMEFETVNQLTFA